MPASIGLKLPSVHVAIATNQSHSGQRIATPSGLVLTVRSSLTYLTRNMPHKVPHCDTQGATLFGLHYHVDGTML